MNFQTDHAVIVTDRIGRALWLNSAATGLCGYSLLEVWGSKPGAVLQGEASDRRTIREMSRAVEEGKPFDGYILNYHKAGRIYEAEIHFVPARDALNAVDYFIATESEVKRRVSPKQQRRLTNELKELLRELVRQVEVAD